MERDADLHMAQLMPLPLTVSYFTFLVPAHLDSLGQRAVKRVLVCVYLVTHTYTHTHLTALFPGLPG